MLEIVTEFITEHGIMVLKIAGGSIIAISCLPVGMSISEFIDEKAKLKRLQRDKEHSSLFEGYIDERIEERNDRIRQLINDIHKLERDIKRKNTRISNLVKDVNDISGENSSLKDRIAELQETLKNMYTGEQVEEKVQERVKESEGTISQMKIEYETLEQDYNNLSEQYNKLEEDYEDVKEILKRREKNRQKQQRYRDRLKQKEREVLGDGQ